MVCRSGSTVIAAPASPEKASARLVSVCGPMAWTRTDGSSQVCASQSSLLLFMSPTIKQVILTFHLTVLTFR